MNINKKKILIHSLEAEQATLGSIILDNESWDLVSRSINRMDFYSREHQIIYEGIEFLFSDCQAVDIITLSNFLVKKNLFEKIGGFEYLSAIVRNTPATANVIFYVNIIREKSMLRNIISIGKNVIDYSLSGDYTTIEEVIDYAENKVMSLSKRYKRKSFYSKSSDILKKALRKIEDSYYLKKPIIGLSSGFKELDDLTLGFHESDLIIIAGRPSMGKTALAMNIAEHIAINLEKKLLIFSMEMTSTQIVERMLASLGRVSFNRIRNGSLDASDWPRLMNAVKLISKSNFYIYDFGPVDLLEIKNVSRKAIKKYSDLSLIIIDYIQLIKIPGKSENRNQELAEISRSLKSLARELNIPIIALSQLNRSLEQRESKKPLMSDIRESGAIEQDADLIIFIYRDEVYNKNSPEKGRAEVIISKQRNGPIGSFKLDFLSDMVKFENIDKDTKEYWL